MEKQIVILGAGAAGLGANYSLKQKGYNPIVLEKDETYGGLCGNFMIAGFRFDRFVHFDFTQIDDVFNIFKKSTDMYIHQSNPFNIYNGIWIKHPAQNNLYPLSEEEKRLIVDDFKKRPKNVDTSSVENFEEWLRLQFGNYFAEHFPLKYARKYWMHEARELETKWMGSKRGCRLYQPTIEEVETGCKSPNTPITYYSKNMRYPKKGGFKSFFNELVKDIDLHTNAEVSFINIATQTIKCTTPSGNISFSYDRLISSLPLPKIVSMLESVPGNVREAAEKLKATSGYQVSIGLKGTNIPPYLWWYIYDEDILPARVYSPSLKSPDNAPEGCSSLQLEIYCEKDKYTKEELLAGSVDKLIEQGVIRKEDILFIDVRFEPYANVIFDHNIYEARKIVRNYLASIGIETIGRFGEWDYLWSDQALYSGLSIK